MICEIFTTEVFFSPLDLAGIRTFPGAFASTRLDVIATATTVFIRLRLNSFDWIIRTGRRKPGPDPLGAVREDHHISPRFTPTLPRPGTEIAFPQDLYPGEIRLALFYKQHLIAQ